MEPFDRDALLAACAERQRLLREVSEDLDRLSAQLRETRDRFGERLRDWPDLPPPTDPPEDADGT